MPSPRRSKSFYKIQSGRRLNSKLIHLNTRTVLNGGDGVRLDVVVEIEISAWLDGESLCDLS